jgi:signal transduction histidine kinase
VIATPTGRYELMLSGDVRAVNRSLAEVTTRLSWFVAAMLAAIVLTWLAIEVRIIRRITLLTRGAAGVSMGVRGNLDLESIDVPDLRGSDELGVLARALKDLLQRVNDDVKRERIRAEQEKDTWHAVGHEIMSPLQSLMVLHGSGSDPSHRYISRMQQAVKVLYGSASPSEAFAATTLTPLALDLEAFLADAAANAAFIGVGDVHFEGSGAALWVRADAHPLEDVVSHVLRNADRHRVAGTPIRISLHADAAEAVFDIDNDGAAIDASLIDRIFEYGVSGDTSNAESGHRGQGLFVVRTYMAKMGGTVMAINIAGGVRFRLVLPCAVASGTAPADSRAPPAGAQRVAP